MSSQPKIYRVLVMGENLLLQTGSERVLPHGFYQTHWVQAVDSDQAGSMAVETAKAQVIVRDAMELQENDPPRLTVEEVEEVEGPEGASVQSTGMAIFVDGT